MEQYAIYITDKNDVSGYWTGKKGKDYISTTNESIRAKLYFNRKRAENMANKLKETTTGLKAIEVKTIGINIKSL